MAKKPTSSKSAEAAAKPTAKSASKPAPKKAAALKAKAAPKAAKAPTAARTKVKAAPVTKPTVSITPADIALRAYFIAEKRQKLGLHGDSTSDWVEAERQLHAEAALQAKK